MEWDAFKAAAPNLGLTLRACAPPEIGECGEATQYSYIATASPPADELCAKGDVADLVKNSSYFTWTCKGAGGGTDKNCQSQHASYCLASPIAPLSTTFSYQVNGGSWQSGAPTVAISDSSIVLGSGSTTYGFTGDGNAVSNGAGSYTLL